MAKKTKKPAATRTLGASGAREVLDTLTRYAGIRFANSADKANALRALALIEVADAPADETPDE